MSDTHNISPFDPGHNGKSHLPEDKLMAYLEGRLNPVEQREVEKWLADEGMESDAVEGLGMLQPNEVRLLSGRINHHLRKSLPGRQRKRKKLLAEYITWAAVVCVLVLVIAAFLVIRLLKH